MLISSEAEAALFIATAIFGIVLSAAIIKLGKIVPACCVYRAPGGALPNSFWHKNAEGVQGGGTRRPGPPAARTHACPGRHTRTLAHNRHHGCGTGPPDRQVCGSGVGY